MCADMFEMFVDVSKKLCRSPCPECIPPSWVDSNVTDSNCLRTVINCIELVLWDGMHQAITRTNDLFVFYGPFTNFQGNLGNRSFEGNIFCSFYHNISLNRRMYRLV